LAEIKRRGIDSLQDFEDEIMISGRVSATNKIKMMETLKKETDKSDEFNDKMRLLLILIFCGNDLNDIKQAIEAVKMTHADRFDDTFIE
jgi:hypothetical protein